MESSQNNLDKLRDLLTKYIQSLKLPKNEVSDLIYKIDIVTQNMSERINLIFLGNTNSGRTSSINLLINYFLNGEIYERDSNSESSTPLMSNDETENFQLISDKTENTYFYFLIESSESNYYKLIIKLNELENGVLALNKALAPFISYNNFSKEYTIEKEFSNTEEGIKELNSMLRNIDTSSVQLMEKARKQEVKSSEQFKSSSFSYVKIQAPGFPEKYRIVDTPKLTPERFAEDILDNTSSELFYCFNIFIFVNETSCLTTFSTDSAIMNNSNDYGNPVVYSFYTKGLNFVEKLKKDEKKSKRQADIDRGKYLNINKNYFGRIKNLKEKGVLFRKIIPIIDDDFQNQEVKASLCLFLKDLKHLNKHREKLFYNNKLNKLKLIVKRFIKKYNNEDSLNPEDLDNWENNKKLLNDERCDKLKEYFDQFDSFDNYEKKYPHHIYQLEKFYEENDSNKDLKFIRSKYIRKNMRDAFFPFRKIILKGAEEINYYYLSKFSYPSDYEQKKKIEELLEKKINADGCLDDLNLIKVSDFYNLLSLATLYRLFYAGLFYSFLYKANEFLNWFSISYLSLLPRFMTAFFILNALENKIGLWTYERAKKETSKALFEWFLKNKKDLLSKYIESFNEIVDDFAKEELKHKKILDPKIPAFIKIFDNFREKDINEELFDFSLNEILDCIQSEDLVNFIKEAIQ